MNHMEARVLEALGLQLGGDHQMMHTKMSCVIDSGADEPLPTPTPTPEPLSTIGLRTLYASSDLAPKTEVLYDGKPSALVARAARWAARSDPLRSRTLSPKSAVNLALQPATTDAEYAVLEAAICKPPIYSSVQNLLEYISRVDEQAFSGHLGVQVTRLHLDRASITECPVARIRPIERAIRSPGSHPVRSVDTPTQTAAIDETATVRFIIVATDPSGTYSNAEYERRVSNMVSELLSVPGKRPAKRHVPDYPVTITKQKYAEHIEMIINCQLPNTADAEKLAHAVDEMTRAELETALNITASSSKTKGLQVLEKQESVVVSSVSNSSPPSPLRPTTPPDAYGGTRETLANAMSTAAQAKAKEMDAAKHADDAAEHLQRAQDRLSDAKQEKAQADLDHRSAMRALEEAQRDEYEQAPADAVDTTVSTSPPPSLLVQRALADAERTKLNVQDAHRNLEAAQDRVTTAEAAVDNAESSLAAAQESTQAAEEQLQTAESKIVPPPPPAPPAPAEFGVALEMQITDDQFNVLTYRACLADLINDQLKRMGSETGRSPPMMKEPDDITINRSPRTGPRFTLAIVTDLPSEEIATALAGYLDGEMNCPKSPAKILSKSPPTALIGTSVAAAAWSTGAGIVFSMQAEDEDYDPDRYKKDLSDLATNLLSNSRSLVPSNVTITREPEFGPQFNVTVGMHVPNIESARKLRNRLKATSTSGLGSLLGPEAKIISKTTPICETFHPIASAADDWQRQEGTTQNGQSQDQRPAQQLAPAPQPVQEYKRRPSTNFTVSVIDDECSSEEYREIVTQIVTKEAMRLQLGVVRPTDVAIRKVSAKKGVTLRIGVTMADAESSRQLAKAMKASNINTITQAFLNCAKVISDRLTPVVELDDEKEASCLQVKGKPAGITVSLDVADPAFDEATYRRKLAELITSQMKASEASGREDRLMPTEVSPDDVFLHRQPKTGPKFTLYAEICAPDEPSALAVAFRLEEVNPDDIGLVFGDEVNVTSVTEPAVELLNPPPKPRPAPGPSHQGSTRSWRDDALGNPTKQLGCAYEVTPSAAIPGRNKQKLYAVTVKECQELCCGMYSTWCKSFDYHKGKSACDLNDKDADDVGG